MTVEGGWSLKTEKENGGGCYFLEWYDTVSQQLSKNGWYYGGARHGDAGDGMLETGVLDCRV